MENAGIEVTYDAELAGADLAAAIAEVQPEVLVVRSTQVDQAIVDAADNLQLIVRAGAGYDTIDHNHCSRRGIYVANCPGVNANAVSELTMGLILAIDRRIAESTYQLKTGNWNKGLFSTATGIKGRTLGLIGGGNIAQLVCKAASAFDMEVIVSSRSRRPGLDQKLGFTYVSQDELLATSDIVSLHTPSTRETRKMVNIDFLSKMKSNSVLINTARADLVDDDTLLAKLDSCPNFWVGTDVFNNEPDEMVMDDFENPIASHPRVYGTHHCGASTHQSEVAIGEEAVRVIRKFVEEGVVDRNNWVNKASPIGSALCQI